MISTVTAGTGTAACIALGAAQGIIDGAFSGTVSGAVAGGLTSKVCFRKGTSVSTSIGMVAIEDVRAGDLVWSTDPETGETELKRVAQLFCNETSEWIHLTIKGEEIVCTPEHPFYSPVKGWTAACKLRAGDILVTVNGEYVVLEMIQHKILESPETTYNFEVEDFHTYYVGSTEVLVHNMCAKEVGTYLIKDTTDDIIYVGKGTKSRMDWSMNYRHGSFGVFYPASSNKIALANEAYFMAIYGGAKSVNPTSGLLNAINSPGLKYLFEWF